jgi:hypothetical protein
VNSQELFKQFPIRRIKPFDGMVVTAEVWDEAHDYHRQQLRYHNLLNHQPGILTGLEVIASDPPDSAVYIQPGIAVDAAGRTIILPEAQAFDLGAAQGPLYLRLAYDESQPKADDTGLTSLTDPADVMLFVRAQYDLEAGDAAPDPDGPYIELARIVRQGADSVITNARQPVQPNPNEIDLRFRREIGRATLPTVRLGVCYTGQARANSAERHGAGALQLARVLRQKNYQAWVDDAVSVAPGADLSAYTLVYLVAQDSPKLEPDEMTVLYNYLQGGGTLLLEVCRKINGAEAAVAALLDMLSSFGLSLTDLPADHDLLHEPHFFAVPPAGYDSVETSSLKIGDGVIVSTYDYGCVWQGERHGQPAAREEIRAAHEWGTNIVAYALARQRQARAGKP